MKVPAASLDGVRHLPGWPDLPGVPTHANGAPDRPLGRVPVNLPRHPGPLVILALRGLLGWAETDDDREQRRRDGRRGVYGHGLPSILA